MQIITYVTDMYANEETPIYRPLKLEKIKGELSMLHFDKPSKTTLLELYKDGWTIKSIKKDKTWFWFFLEKS